MRSRILGGYFGRWINLVLCRIERRPPRLDLTVYPCLPRASVATTSARTYLDLLPGAAS